MRSSLLKMIPYWLTRSLRNQTSRNIVIRPGESEVHNYMRPTTSCQPYLRRPAAERRSQPTCAPHLATDVQWPGVHPFEGNSRIVLQLLHRTCESFGDRSRFIVRYDARRLSKLGCPQVQSDRKHLVWGSCPCSYLHCICLLDGASTME
jgi:hypothetical protein